MIHCVLCDATTPDVESAMATGWCPSFYDENGEECSAPICAECIRTRCFLDENEEPVSLPNPNARGD